MSTMIALNDGLAQRLQVEAESLHMTVDSVANGLLERLFPPPISHDDGALLTIVERIRRIAPDAAAIRAAVPIADDSPLIGEAAGDDFDETEWNRQWAEFEAGLKAHSLLNAMAEGRG